MGKKKVKKSIRGIKIPGLRGARYRQDLSIERLAALIGVSAWAVRQWENGETGVRPGRLPELMRALRASEQDLTTAPEGELPTPSWLQPKPPKPPYIDPVTGRRPGPKGVPLPGLRAVRYRLQLGTLDFANRIGVSPGTVSRWESGKGGVQRSRLAEIASRLGVNVSQLTEAPTTPPPDELPWQRQRRINRRPPEQK